MHRFKSKWMLFLLLGLAMPLCGLTEDAPLRFVRLDLADGRKLKDVVVKTYDANSGKLLLIASGKAMTIPIDLVPQPFRDRLKAEAPPSGDTSSVVSVSPPADLPLPARIRMAPPARTAADGDEAAQQQLLARHQQAALERAKNYYRYEFRVGSDATVITALNFETSQPEAMPGWPGRYRTEGKAYLEFFDSKGRSYGRTWSTFEVITEQKPKEALTVIDFSKKS